MAKILYTTGIFFYGLAIRMAAIFNPKAKDFIRGRKSWTQKLKSITGKNENWIWIHCSSLGEFEQGRPVIEKIKKAYPGQPVLLSFFSPSGYKAKKDYPMVDAVVYMPLDTPGNAKRFVKILNPALVIFIKYEFWYHHLNQLYKNKIPVYLISAAFRKSQVFFKWYGGIFRKMLAMYNTIFLQDDFSEALINRIAETETMVCGDTRFDRVKEISQVPFNNDILEAFAQDQEMVLIAGSTWPPDENIISESFDANAGIKVIIAPHEINDNHLNKIRDFFKNKKISFFTNTTTEEASNSEILVLDTIGLLSRIYRYGHMAYVGGGFGSGIHNVLEPASYQLPVVFGPNHYRFIEAKELINAGAAFPVNNHAELSSLINKCKDLTFRKKCHENARKYIQKKSGATDKIFHVLEKSDVFKH
ncbi:MAG: 3-deoxy-D-manno-octulosonic acid transferase [Bacteroidota bacterium]